MFKGYRKLIDVPDDRRQFRDDLVFRLVKHGIRYRVSLLYSKNDARRFFVESENLCLAQAIVSALENVRR